LKSASFVSGFEFRVLACRKFKISNERASMKPAPSTSRANPLVETLGVAVWGALRFFAIALFVLLVVNSVAILTLNLVYETEALRHRYYWPGVLSRNAILGIFVFLLYLFANSRPSVGKASADRFSSLKVKALRVLS
jgi:hypothetical protein